MPENKRPIRILAAPAAYILNDKGIDSMGLIYYNLMKALGDFNVEFLALTMKSNIESTCPNVRPVEVLGKKTKLDQMSILKFIYAYYRWGKKLLREKKIDLIHHMGPFGYRVGFNPLLLFGNTQRYPFVLGPLIAPHIETIKTYDELTMAKEYGDNYRLRRSGKKTFRSYLFDKLMKVAPLVGGPLFRKTLLRAGIVIAGDKYTKNLYLPYVTPRRLKVIPIGIDLLKFYPKHTAPKKEKKQEILTVGYLSNRKGIHYLVQAMARVSKVYPYVRLRIVGDGPQRPLLEDLTKKLSLEKYIIFEGSKPPNFPMVQAYQRCDIFCLPALSDTWVALQEAMACGKPVITTNVSSHAERVIEGKSGLLVPPQRVEPLAQAIIRLLKDPFQREEMGKTARRHMEENHNWHKIAQQYYNLYQRLLRK